MSLALNLNVGFPSSGRSTTDVLDCFSEIECSFNHSVQLCEVAIRHAAPLFFSKAMLEELNRFARMAHDESDYPFRYRVLSSRKKKVFSLGGDLAFFRSCIDRADRTAIEQYARIAVDSIWESITASGRSDMLSLTLVQGEAQGGGFEAALAGHVLVAEKGAMFGFPEGLFGLFPGMGARQLLSARASNDTANRLIGSARRYSAEELFEEGIVDVLADNGDGWNVIYNICSQKEDRRLWDLRERFCDVTRRELDETVEEWVAQAMSLSTRHLKTIDYLLQAQKRAARSTPTVRVV